jgi:hypothetical protein
LFAAGLSLIIVQRTKMFYSQLYGKSLSWVGGKKRKIQFAIIGGVENTSPTRFELYCVKISCEVI